MGFPYGLPNNSARAAIDALNWLDSDDLNDLDREELVKLESLLCHWQKLAQRRISDYLGMDWWNGLNERDRGFWADVAGSARPVDAWNVYRALRAGAC